MSELKPLNDEERAELVAYLDGELNEEATQRVEAQLQRDPRCRAEVDALRKTWELLDYLPQPAPSTTFTHRTIERISALRPAAGNGEKRWRAWVGGLSWAAAVVLCGAAGYAAMTHFSPRAPSDEELAPDLRIIENLRYYEAAGDLDFVRDLDNPDRFGEDSLGS